MKKLKILVLFIFMFCFITNVKAADLLMRCTYDKTILNYGTATEQTNHYVKFKVEYYADETMKRYAVMSGDTEYKEYVTGNSFTVFREDTGGVSSRSTESLTPDFKASDLKKYYEAKTCPYMQTYNVEGYIRLQLGDEEINNNYSNATTYSSKATKSEFFDKNGNEEVVKEPTVTKECAVHVNGYANVPRTTFVLSMKDNGKKYLNVYLTKDARGNSTRELTNDVNHNIFTMTDVNVTYRFYVRPEDISGEDGLFYQTDIQARRNTFICPGNIYLVENGANGFFVMASEEKAKALSEEYGTKVDYTTEGYEGETRDNDLTQDITNFGICDAYITDASTGASTPNGTLIALKIVGYVIFIAKMLVPLLLIIMGSVDFAKATISSDEKAGKEAFATLIKRIITGLIIFAIPTLLDLVISLIDEASDTLNDSNFSNCADCLLDPLGDCQASIFQSNANTNTKPTTNTTTNTNSNVITCTYQDANNNVSITIKNTTPTIKLSKFNASTVDFEFGTSDIKYADYSFTSKTCPNYVYVYKYTPMNARTTWYTIWVGNTYNSVIAGFDNRYEYAILSEKNSGVTVPTNNTNNNSNNDSNNNNNTNNNRSNNNANSVTTKTNVCNLTANVDGEYDVTFNFNILGNGELEYCITYEIYGKSDSKCAFRFAKDSTATNTVTDDYGGTTFWIDINSRDYFWSNSCKQNGNWYLKEVGSARVMVYNG